MYPSSVYESAALAVLSIASPEKSDIIKMVIKGEGGCVMDDPDDPLVTQDRVPAYGMVEQKIKEIDSTIIVYRIYYLFNSFTFRFQLIKKDKMCMLEIPRVLLENIGKDGAESENELFTLLNRNIEDSECWKEFQG